jgi:hypothetical protein
MEKDTHDEVEKWLKTASDTFKKHAETINTLNENQKVLVNEISEIKKNTEVSKRVEEIIKETQKEASKVEATPAPAAPAAPPAAPVAPPVAPPAETPAPATPAAPVEEKKEA